MAEPQKLSLADHAVIHLTAYLAAEWPQETWDAFKVELAEILPRANRAIPVVAAMAAVADLIVTVKTRSDLVGPRYQGWRATVGFHQSRAVAAIEALRAADETAGEISKEVAR